MSSTTGTLPANASVGGTSETSGNTTTAAASGMSFKSILPPTVPPERRRLEFQAVILAGGNPASLYPLLEDNKCLALLPIANRPLLYYQLKLLEKAGFAEVIIAVEESFRKAVHDFVTKQNIKIKVELFHPKLDDQWETATVLKQLAPKIFTDFFVISGDLVSEASIHDLADVHRTRDASATILLKENEPIDWKSSTKPATFSYAAVQQEEIKTFFGLQEVGQHMSDYRVVMSRASEREDGSCMLGRNLLDKCPRFTLHTNLADAHLYIFKRWVLDIIELHNFPSLKDDLLPYLVSIQFRKDFATKNAEIWAKAKSTQALAHSMSSAAWIAPSDDDRIRVYSFVLPYKKGGSVFCARANSLEAFSWMSFAILEHSVSEMTPWDAFMSAQPILSADEPSDAASLRSSSADKQLKAVKTLLGQGCTIHPSASLTKCIIGDNCSIGPNVKMRNCLVLSNCKIEEGSQVENTLLANGVIIQKKCVLNKCQVGPKYVVIGGTTVEENALLVNQEDDVTDSDGDF
jgi:translation initiation factor eIF-2B subunit gamma